MTRISVPAAAAAVSLLLTSSPLSAQAAFIPSVIGTTVGNMAASGAVDEKCLLGKRTPAPEAVAEAKSGAEGAMRAYLALAGAADKADVSAAFTRKAKLRFWLRDGKDTFVTHVEDPFARAAAGGHAAVAGPLAFVRSGDGATALAAWRVEATTGEPLGHYRVGFRREAKAWKITRMDLVGPGAEPEPVAYYCSVPGDSEAYAKALAEREAKRAAKRAARAARRG